MASTGWLRNDSRAIGARRAASSARMPRLGIIRISGTQSPFGATLPAGHGRIPRCALDRLPIDQIRAVEFRFAVDGGAAPTRSGSTTVHPEVMSDEALANRVGGGRGPGFHTNFGQDVQDVILDRMLTDRH